MTLAEILDDVLLGRFGASVRQRAKRAVNNRFAHLWNLEQWTWKFATANPTTVADTAALDTMPSDFGVVLDLWDENGDRLPDITPREYYDRYLVASSGTPEAYTVIDGCVLVGPTPAAAATWTLLHEKRLTLLDEETDTPDMPAEFHLALVHGARAELLAIYNDPTAPDIEALWALDLDALRRGYLSDVAGEPSVWPADPTCW